MSRLSAQKILLSFHVRRQKNKNQCDNRNDDKSTYSMYKKVMKNNEDDINNLTGNQDKWKISINIDVEDIIC